MINSLAGQSAISSRTANLFSKIDANTDGSVTKEEFIAAFSKNASSKGISEADAASLFAQIDSEGNGSIDESQLTKGLEKTGNDKNRSEAKSRDIGNSLADIALQAILQLVQNANASNETTSNSDNSKDDLFGKIDGDGNGKVTKEEFIAARPNDVSEEQATQLFTSIDTEGTGSITKSQFDEATNANQPKGAPSGSPPSGPPPSGGSASGGSASSSGGTKTYDALDTNEDGTVSMAELLAGLQSETEKSGNESTKALLTAITDAINTYATNNSIDLENISAFKSFKTAA